MGTVTVDANVFTVYGDYPSAKIYLSGSISPAAKIWRTSIDDNEKQRSLVSAKRLLDAIQWQGTATGADAWPRSGVIVNGVPVDSSTVPTAIINAEYEWAAIIFATPASTSSTTNGSNIKKVDAKGVSVEYFHATDVGAFSSLYPPAVQAYVLPYLSSANAPSVSAYYSSTCPDVAIECTDSSFVERNQYDLKGPLG